MTTKEMQKQEAIKRLEYLQGEGLMDWVVRDFKESGKVCFSECGILFHAGEEPEYAEAIRDFEQKHNATVYHLVLTHTSFGKHLSFMFVADDEDWPMDWSSLHRGYSFAWVENLTYPELSEFGSIAFACQSGGIVRVG